MAPHGLSTQDGSPKAYGMTIPALARSPVPTPRAWLATRWPVGIWLIAAVVIMSAGAKIVPESFRQAVALTDIPAQDRAEMRQALASLHLSPRHLAWYQLGAFTVVGTLVNLSVGC